MLDNLETEQANPASEGIDGRSTEEILRIINAEDQQVGLVVAEQIPPITQAVDRIANQIQKGGRLFYAGAGTSGRLGVLDAAECPPTFQVSPDVVQGMIAGGEAALARATEVSEDEPDLGAQDLAARGFREDDVLVGIAASGRTPYVLGAIEQARRTGALTVGLSCNPDSPLASVVDIAITPRTGPEIVAGSTRLKAGTATKLVLNMISTAVMIRLGYVYGNLMVNVKPANSKLIDRARRIIRDAAGVTLEEAARLLDAAGGSVKAAILMAKLSIGREQAEQRLEAVGGRLSAALKK